MTRGVVNDLTGKTFGNLTVVGRTVSDRHNNAQWICKCSCGNEAVVRGVFLRKGQMFCSKQCLTYIATRLDEVAGQEFGRLTAVQRIGFTTSRKAVWEFSCACGSTHVSTLDSVKQGFTRSCGCLAKESRLTRDGASLTRAGKNAYWRAYMDRRNRAGNSGVVSDEVLAIYAEAKRLTEETGIPHEVDHEIPLKGRLVSGLHVLANLRVVTRAENRRKSNRHLS